MSIVFGNIPQRAGTWSWFKPLIAQKSVIIQYEEDPATYTVYGYDLPEVLYTTIWKGTVPDGVVASGYSQAQNDADKADFETNFKDEANRSIDDIPSKIYTSTVRPVGGGSANLSVDGSVTPVVFEFNPPANYDIQINALSLLFETSQALIFGNKFLVTALGTLTNGMLLECKALDQAVTWQNMRRTRDLFEIARDFTYVTGTTNFIKIDIFLPQNLRLSRDGTFAQPDYLRVTVRDNLAVAAISFAEVYFQGNKV